MDKFVFIKDLKIYGNIINSWDTNEGMNYIIKDLNGIEHERYEQEFELVDNIEDSIKKAKCNLSLEKLLELFTEIDKRYTLYCEFSQKKENCHSDIYVPYVFVRYGNPCFTCYINNGELKLSTNENQIFTHEEYECCLFYYDTDFKDAIFELYMNIVTRLEIKDEN